MRFIENFELFNKNNILTPLKMYLYTYRIAFLAYFVHELDTCDKGTDEDA